MMMAVLGTISCSKDLYDEGKANELKEAEEAAKQAQINEQYKANFIKTYGEISPTQSWDFSTKDVTFGTASSNARTRNVWDYLWSLYNYSHGWGGHNNNNGGNNQPGNLVPAQQEITVLDCVSNIDQWYIVPDPTLSLMNRVFKEGRDNEDYMEGTFFKMQVPTNDFYILPIYMGQSGGDFTLYLHVDGVANDIPVWNKWQNIAYKLTGNEWNFTRLSKTNNRNGENTYGVRYIAAQPVKIDVSKLPQGNDMYFYLLITEKASIYNHEGDQLGCLNGYIKEYKYSANDVKPTGLPGMGNASEISCKLLGCEDASTENTDQDYNDVVFLCYGKPDVPPSDPVQDLFKFEAKRYMIEDLGDADDSDFNDIVVDVVESFKATIKTSSNGTPLNGKDNPDWIKTGTKAYIRALGGTLDFELTIGTTKWRKSGEGNMPDNWMEMKNTYAPSNDLEPLFSFDVEGYNPELNPISVKVFQKDGEKVANVLSFSPNGSVPMMISTNTNVVWSPERVRFNFEPLQAPEENAGEPETVTIDE